MSSTKVIVIGGGPVGLTAAHALSKAGIDFTLLEQRPSAVIDAGSNLVLQPEGLLTLSSFGILPQINAVSTPLGTIERVNHKGKPIGNVQWFVNMKKNSSVAPRIISRHDLTAVLYNTLPEQRQIAILPNKKLTSIENTSTGVCITCTDGTSYEGSFVIGADGAHSKTRSQMRKLALAEGKLANEESPYLTKHNCLWIRMPINAVEGVTPGISAESHGHGLATQFFAGEETAVLGIYETLAEPTKERQRFGQVDEEALVQRWSHVKILKSGLTIGQMYANTLSAGLVSLEEGVVDHWSLGDKIVLVGDAAHKYTPSTGSGCNNGMVDARVLVEQLQTSSDVKTVFYQYQGLRKEGCIEACAGSGRMTEMATWANGVMSFIDVHVMPRSIVQSFLGKRIQA